MNIHDTGLKAIHSSIDFICAGSNRPQDGSSSGKSSSLAQIELAD